MICRLARGVPMVAVLVSLAAVVGAPGASAARPWNVPSVLGPSGREAGPPEIAIAPDGEAIATWEGSRPMGIQVSTRMPGGDWTPPVMLARAGESEGPHLAVSASKAVIVWRGVVRAHGSETSVVMASTRLRGKGWGKPQNISKEKRWREEPEGSAPQVTITASGKVTAIWTAGDERHTASFIRSATQSAKGISWSAPVALPGSIEGEEAQVGTTPGGEAVAIWGAAYNEESGIEVSNRPAHGKWRRAGRLGFPGPFPHPQLAVTSTGEAIGVWLEEPESGRAAVLKVATRPPGGKWKVEALAPTSYSASPSIVTEPGGRVRLVWAIFGPSGTTAEVVSSTHLPGDAWTAPVGLAAEGLQLPQGADPRIAVTAAGESIAVWAAAGPTGEASVVEEASKPAGGTWSAPIKISMSYPAPKSGSISDLQLKLTPSGEALAIWSGFNGTERVIEGVARPAA